MNDDAERRITKSIELIADSFDRLTVLFVDKERRQREYADNDQGALLMWCRSKGEPCYFCGSTSGQMIARGVRIIGCSVCLNTFMAEPRKETRK